MAWFRKEKKPRLPRVEKLEIPADAWEKCEACGHTDIREKFVRNLNVCPECDFHRRIRAAEYAQILLDEGSIEVLESDLRSSDPLHFPEYQGRLKKSRGVAGDQDAVLTVTGMLAGAPINLGAMDFSFMGGSMGSVVGEKLARLGQRSLERKYPLVIISASGGARMQEGVLSLMQMAKVSAVLSQLAERRIPYVSLLTNPTTGGVSASYAMLGDAIIAEPGAVIGFAGPRVIKQTLGQDLPEGFQTAEFLLDHGMLDAVVHRRELKRTLAQLLRHMSGKPAATGVGELTAYQQALEYLFARTTGTTKFGLHRTEALLAALGDPHRRMPVFHVAGTNGKGSVCATLEVLLRARGLRVGRYTSPHLVDFRERFLVDGHPAPAEQVADFVQRWTPEVERLGATFFEATTAMAFDLFAHAEVDVAVIETGLGGRLDSTNVVTPVVAAVTSIGIDHTEYLGDTREAIAAEKAGIFKPMVPAVIGDSDPAIAGLLANLAVERSASPVLRVDQLCRPHDVSVGHDGTRFSLSLDGEECAFRTPLTGTHQAWNAALALLMTRAAGERYAMPLADAVPVLERVRLPGRYQEVGRFVFDVAHNPDGAGVLVKTLAAVAPPRPVIALLTVLVDKDWRGIMDTLATQVDGFVLTRSPTAPASRAWDPEEAGAYARERGWSSEVVPDFDAAIARAEQSGATVLITGSFHTVGDAMARLQVDPLAG